MASSTKSRRRKRGDKPVTKLPQLERSQLRNRFAPIAALDEEQLELIHDASLDILEDLGIEVLGEEALALFRSAGADISDDGVVRLDRAMVLETIAHAPSDFTLTPRNPDNAIACGGNAINFGLVSGPPNVHDAINGRRAGNIKDYADIIRLGQSFNVIDFA